MKQLDRYRTNRKRGIKLKIIEKEKVDNIKRELKTAPHAEGMPGQIPV